MIKFSKLNKSSAVAKDVLMVMIAHEFFGEIKDDDKKTFTKLLVLVASLLLEDIGQTFIQFAYYEQFVNQPDAFAIINAVFMVRKC